MPHFHQHTNSTDTTRTEATTDLNRPSHNHVKRPAGTTRKPAAEIGRPVTLTNQFDRLFIQHPLSQASRGIEYATDLCHSTAEPFQNGTTKSAEPKIPTPRATLSCSRSNHGSTPRTLPDLARPRKLHR